MTEQSDKFKSLVQDVSKEYEEAEVFNNWMPPDGDYTVLLSDCATGESEKNGEEFAWIRLTGAIQMETDPELDQKEFTVGFYSTRAPFALKNDVAVLAGKRVNNIMEGIQVVEQAAKEGWVVVAEVSTTKKHGKTYRNSRLQEVLPNEDSGNNES